jgi:hypothetical protein
MLHYLFLLLELFSQGRAPIDSARIGASNSAEQCKGCHLEEYTEWRASRHSMAWTNDFFQLDYQKNKASTASLAMSVVTSSWPK